MYPLHFSIAGILKLIRTAVQLGSLWPKPVDSFYTVAESGASGTMHRFINCAKVRGEYSVDLVRVIRGFRTSAVLAWGER